MTEPPHSSPDSLWRRLAEAQDAAIVGGPSRMPQPTARAATPLAGVRRSRRLRPAVLLLGALAAAGVVVLVRHRTAPWGWSDRTDPLGGTGRVVLTDARGDLPLQFSDGSILTFRAGSAGGVKRLGDSGADVVLDRGRLDAHVVHADSTLWLVHAGPFKVRVTGTRFTVRWSAKPTHLDVAVYQGSVLIDGAALGAGVPLGAGHRLTVENGIVRTDLIAYAPEARRQTNQLDPAQALDQPGEQAEDRAQDPAANGLPQEVGPAPRAMQAPGSIPAPILIPAPPILIPATAPDSIPDSTLTAAAVARAHDGDWLPLARRGAYRQALATAKRVGWDNLCGRLDARRLLMLGDVARYAGAPLDAERVFGWLVARYPTHRLAGDALFSLGRLAFEAGRPEKAMQWFSRYVDDWPDGPLVDQALGRLMESAMSAEDRTGAQSAARTYLERAPHGPHAPLAHEVLEGSP
jgi:hypothetical protein